MKRRVIAAAVGCLVAAAPVPLHAFDGIELLRDLREYSTGFRHTCAITSAGALWCWGGSTEGQVGDGDFIDRNAPVPVLGLESGVASVAAGRQHTCAVLDDGSARCWGNQRAGTLGDGVSMDVNLPTPQVVPGLGDASEIRTSGLGRGTCVRTLADGVTCWGAPFGPPPWAPAAILEDGAGTLGGVDKVTVGTSFACALLASGTVKCWGRGFSGELGIAPDPEDFNATVQPQAKPVPGLLDSGVTALDVAAGNVHACAVLSSDEVRCWGRSGMHLGRGEDSTADGWVPTPVLGLPGGLAGARLALNWFSSCVEYADGRVYCWGTNTVGQFGDGGVDSSAVAVPALEGRTDIRGVVSSQSHACGMDQSADALVCWGRGDTGQLGGAETTDKLFPQRVALSGVNEIGLGENHVCAILPGGVVHCWGANYGGQLGFEERDAVALPMPVAGLPSGQIEVDGGFDYTCTRDGAGAVRCWGGNDSGQLGVGSSELILFEPQGPLDLGESAIDIDLGWLHACAVLASGAVKCWGRNSGGQLGNGVPIETNSSVAVAVGGLPTAASKVAAGQFHTCALLVDGRVGCWGENFIFQLGRDDSVARSADPLLVPGIDTAIDVSTGPFHSCALLGDGSVRCWGQNFFAGELGDGTRVNSFQPVAVQGLPGPASAIHSGGVNVTCALVDGAPYCWGWNLHGPVGDGSTKPRITATAVALQGKVATQVQSGGLHTCALTTEPAVYCWGWNIYGQIGIGEFSFATRPSTVQIDRAAREIKDVSKANGDGAGEEEKAPVASGDGNFVVYESSTVPPGGKAGTGPLRLLRRNLRTGLVEQVNLDGGGVPLSGDAIESSVSADGRLILFVAPKPSAKAAKLAGAWPKGGATSPFGIFLRNMATGSTTAVANAATAGTGTKPQISADGSVVVFTREADPDEGAPGTLNVFSVPLVAIGNDELVPGAARCESCKTVLGNGQSGDTATTGPSRNPVVSASGAWLAFETEAPNLLATPPSCAGSNVILRNLLTGATQAVSNPAPGGSCGSGGAGSPSIDYAGQNIVFTSSRPLAPTDNNQGNDVYFVKPGGAVRQVSLGEQGSAIGEVGQAVISGNGRTIAFVSLAANLDAREPDNNDSDDLYVQDLRSARLARLSKNLRGAEIGGASVRPSLTYTGTAMMFESPAGNLTAQSAEGTAAVYQRSNALAASVVFDSGFE